MLAVIDYGAGNLRSVLHALKHLQAHNLRLVQHGSELNGASKIILPGVGAFGAGMEQMRRRDLVAPLLDALANGIPYLGICVGMQMLFDVGEEMGEHKGLGVIPGRVLRFPDFPDRKVPHMGWNQLELKGSSALFRKLGESSHVYFVHSYYCAPQDRSATIAAVDYGLEFAAAVQSGNVYGVQFHPEKSQVNGLRILNNFLRIEELADDNLPGN
ncbi:MAG: imidazole glycerol phosphate synthase subunit HisH [Chloroflexi bacterium]|nr:imidazole glycerol phosphate synthase subunit HisH [Chloroflexota bacterium]